MTSSDVGPDLLRTLADLSRAFRDGAPAPRAPRIPLEHVEVELWRVHRIEAARLCADAIDVASDARALEADWRARCRALLASAAGADLPLPRGLRRAAREPIERWPTPRSWRTLARALDPRFDCRPRPEAPRET